jgi:hypothetical protein
MDVMPINLDKCLVCKKAHKQVHQDVCAKCLSQVPFEPNCPCCQRKHGEAFKPNDKMQSLVADGKVYWTCARCINVRKPQYCGWCCRVFVSPTKREFCDAACRCAARLKR